MRLNEGHQMMKNGFSQRLKELRRQANLSQVELANIVGVHSIHVSRYERGISKPKSDTLKKLAQALGVTADYLIEGKTTEAAKASLEDKELLQMFKEIEKLSKEEKSFIKQVIDALLTKKKIQQLA
jgi:transcriptional regulator with XRE-family HTH domain